MKTWMITFLNGEHEVIVAHEIEETDTKVIFSNKALEDQHIVERVVFPLFGIRKYERYEDDGTPEPIKTEQGEGVEDDG